MDKKEYKEMLHRRYPDELENVLELAWHFHGIEKAKKYIQLLGTCNHNADLAYKAMRMMYVTCDIDAVKATSEKFIALLLPFTCMEKTANPHAVSYHIRKMLADDTVRKERKAEEQRQNQRLAMQIAPQQELPASANVTFQIEFRTDNEEFIRQIILMASTYNGVSIKECKLKEPTPPDNYSYDLSSLVAPNSIVHPFSGCITRIKRILRPKYGNYYLMEGTIKVMPAVIANLRSIFGKEAPRVKYTSEHEGSKNISMFEAQEIANEEGKV